MSTSKERRDTDTAHALPKFFDWMQAYLMLPLLLISEGVINGSMMSLGVNTDTLIGSMMYGCLYATGFVMGGMALRCSVKSAACFARGETGSAVFNFLGILLFAIPEVWASLVTRSLDLPITNPDTWLNELLRYLLGTDSGRLTPTNIIVSLALPLVTLYWGFSAHKPPVADAADAEARERLKNIKAAGRAERLALYAKAAGSAGGGLIKSAKESYTGQHEEESGAPQSEAFVMQEETSHASHEEGLIDDKQTASGRKRTSVAEVSAIPPGHWGWTELRAYVLRAYGHDMGEQRAKSAMRQMPKRVRITTAGRPYYAPQQSVRAWADKQTWPAASSADDASQAV
jgi:hypothetical protein